MRLFLAVPLSPSVMEALCTAQADLRRQGRGSFPPPKNLHLTLAFLGELPGPEAAVRALEQVRVPGFSLTTAPPGRFPGGRGALWWVGLEPAPGLLAAREALVRALDGQGLWMDPKPFLPHLTLGRQVRLREDFDAAAWEAALPRLTCRVDRLTLMRSQRVQGRLTYAPLYRRRLGKP